MCVGVGQKGVWEMDYYSGLKTNEILPLQQRGWIRELSMTLYTFHRHRVCLADHVDLIFSLCSWWEGFGSSSLATLPLGFNFGFISTSACGSSTGV